MRVGLAGQRVNERKVVGEGAEFGEEIAGHLSAISPRLEVTDGLDQVAVLALKSVYGSGHRGVVATEKLGLVFPGVDVADGSRAVNDKHLLGLGGEMGFPGGKGPVGIDLRADRASQQMIIGKQTGQSHATEGGSRAAQERTPVEERSSGGGQVFRLIRFHCRKRNSLALRSTRQRAGRPCSFR